MRWVLLASFVLTVACGGSSQSGGTPTSALGAGSTHLGTVAPGSASEAAQRLDLARMHGEASVAWGMLYPNQQALVTQAQFSQCFGHGADLPWSAIDIQSESREVVASEGVQTTTVVRTHESIHALAVLQGTHDWVQVDGVWRWVMGAQALKGIERNDCPPL